MFCVHCGKEIEDNTLFCTYCGGEQGAVNSTNVEENSVASQFYSVFSDTKFHLATLFFLVSTCASALATIVTGSMPLPVLEIFIIISLFKLEKLAKQGAPLLSFASPLKTIRIIMDIYRVVLWVLVGIFGVCGIILCASGSFIGIGVADIFESILNEYNFSLYAEELSELGGFLITGLGIILIVAAVACALFNIFMYGSFYKTAKSTEWTAGTGNYMIEKLETTSKWLIFSIVMSAISALFTGFSGVQKILTVVSIGFNIAFIVLVLELIKKLKKQ